jgi:hypothetical protein
VVKIALLTMQAVGEGAAINGPPKLFFAEPAFLRFVKGKPPAVFPPEVLLEVSRQTIGIRSCVERGRSKPPCSGP